MNVDRYLQRIGYEGPRGRSAATLRHLHRRHMLTVPFENLDVGRKPIVIDESAFVRKIVEQRRGGFCYELNGSFSALLRDLGFGLILLSAGVARDQGGFGPDYDHMALLVEADGKRWLADVGFGDCFLEPLCFETGRDLKDPAGICRIVADGHAFVLTRNGEPQYRFMLTPHTLDQYTAMCHFHQTSPQSTFTRKSVCSLATETGRVTLSGHRLIITTTAGGRVERDLASHAEWVQTLQQLFGVTLPDPA